MKIIVKNSTFGPFYPSVFASDLLTIHIQVVVKYGVYEPHRSRKYH